jgi:hypothetical protein
MKPTVLVAGEFLVTATKGLVSCYSFPNARAKPTALWERRFSSPMTTGKLGSVAGNCLPLCDRMRLLATQMRFRSDRSTTIIGSRVAGALVGGDARDGGCVVGAA